MPEQFEPTTEGTEGRVEDIDEAWIGAKVAKPFEEARLVPELSDDDRALLRKVSERQAEKAMAEHREEVEKNPREQLLLRIDKAEQALREKGLAADVAILEKFRARFLKTLERNKQYIKKWETEHNDNFLDRLAKKEIGHFSWKELRHRELIFAEIGDGGGWVSGTWFGGKEDLEKYADSIKKHQEAGHELINYTLSPEAETVLYRALGALHEDEDIRDLRKIWEQDKDNKHDERKRLVGGFSMGGGGVSLGLATELPGVSLAIRKEPRRSYDGKRESSAVIELDDKFLIEALKEK